MHRNSSGWLALPLALQKIWELEQLRGLIELDGSGSGTPLPTLDPPVGRPIFHHLLPELQGRAPASHLCHYVSCPPSAAGMCLASSSGPVMADRSPSIYGARPDCMPCEVEGAVRASTFKFSSTDHVKSYTHWSKRGIWCNERMP